MEVLTDQQQKQKLELLLSELVLLMGEYKNVTRRNAFYPDKIAVMEKLKWIQKGIIELKDSEENMNVKGYDQCTG
jgi:hypothetical protein